MNTQLETVRRAEFLPFSPPSLGEEEIAEVVDTLRTNWISTGPKTRRFEAEFAQYVGAPAALAVNSGTAALHTALLAMGVGPGDEVITSPITFVSCANVIEHTGARPVLVDVEPDTLNLNPHLLERAVTPRTRVVLPVHFTGHPAEMDTIRAIAGRHELKILEDAAHALPARYRGTPVGADGNPVAYSFYATKNMTTAEGGMLTGDPDFVAQAQVVSLHGMSREAWKRYDKAGSWSYEVTLPGFKYNMTDIQASIGLWQLRKLAAAQERRYRVVRLYHEAFAGEEALEIPTTRPEVEHAWHLYVLRLNPERLRIDRDRFVAEMAERNIGTSVHFIPLHLHRYYREKYGYLPEDLPVAYSNFRRMLSLPLHPGLTDRDVADVVEAVLDLCRTFRR